MGVAGAVVSHRLQVQRLQDVEGLEQHRPLRPVSELVDVDPPVIRRHRLLEAHPPARQILQRDQPALLLHAAHELASDVAAVEALVRRHDRLRAARAPTERLALGLHQPGESGGEVGLAEDLTRIRRLPGLPRVRQHHLARVAPLLDPPLLPLDGVRRLGVDRVTVRELDGGAEDVREGEGAVLGQHHHQPAGRAGCGGGERTVLGGITHPPRAEELRRGAGGGNAQGVEADHLAGVRIEDERLGLPAPAQHVPHGGGGGEHRRRRVDGVAAPLEHHRSRGRRERLAGDGHPVPPVQRRLLRLRAGGAGEAHEQHDQ